MKIISSVSLVVPLYNNASTLKKQLKQCEVILRSLKLQYEIIVCDDKSTDNSVEILKSSFSNNPRFRLFFHSKNQGIAKTISSLYHKAKKSYIVLFSVDGDWDPNDIRELVVKAQSRDADIVIGKRNHEGYSLYRKAITFFYNFLPILLFQTETVDAGSIKVIKRQLIQTIPIRSKSVFAEAELIIRAKRQRKKIINVPIHFKKKKTTRGTGGKITLIIQSLIDLIILRLTLK